MYLLNTLKLQAKHLNRNKIIQLLEELQYSQFMEETRL